MKKPILIMTIIIAIIVVVAGGGVATFLYLKHHKKGPAAVHQLSPKQAKGLQVTLPQMTTNLKSSGLIQFTLTLQANNGATKGEVTTMQNQIEDKINEIMRQFTSTTLRSSQGLSQLKQTVTTDINQMLPKGKITKVYFSQVLVQ